MKIERGNTRDIATLNDSQGDDIEIRSYTAGGLKGFLVLYCESGAILDKTGVCDLIGLLSRWVASGRLEE